MNVLLEDLKEYLRIDWIEEDKFLKLILESAKSYVLNNTGLTVEEASKIKELDNAVYLIASDLYDNRSAQATTTMKTNPMLDNILAMHSRNLVG